MPPIDRPEEVAQAVLHAAVHPRREIDVDGAGKAPSNIKSAVPAAYGLLSPAISAFEKRREPPRHPRGLSTRPGKAARRAATIPIT